MYMADVHQPQPYPRVLLGIFSPISDRHRRHMIRSTMLLSPPVRFQYSFVVCGTTSFDHAVSYVSAENARHHQER